MHRMACGPSKKKLSHGHYKENPPRRVSPSSFIIAAMRQHLY